MVRAANVPTATCAVVRGRLVLADGRPATHASVQLHGWGADSERRIRHGVPQDWQDPTTKLDDAGGFSIAFDPPRAFQFSLDVRCDGHAPLSWRWSELVAGSTTDIGTVTLTDGCVVEGDVVDASGRPIQFAARVALESSFTPRGPAGESTSSHVDVDMNSGSFRFVDAPPGAVRVFATGSDGSYLGDTRCEATRTAAARCRIVYSGPDPTRAILLSARCEDHQAFQIGDPKQVVLSGHPNGLLNGTHAIGGSNSFRWIDLPLGRYSLSIDDPRFLPWTKSEVRTGEVVRAALVGSCSVALTVIDPTTRQPVKPSRVRLRYPGATFSPNEFVLEDGSDGRDDGVYGGIVPDETVLIVEASGFAPAEIDLGDLEPRTTIARSIELAPGAMLRGRVTAQGSAMGRGGVTVRLRSGEPAASRSLFLPGEIDDRAHDATTDVEGNYAFDGLMAGPYDVWAERNGAIATAKQRIDVRAGEAATRNLVLPASGSLRARILWKAELPPTGLRIAALAPSRPGLRPPSAFQMFEAIGDTMKPNVTALATDGSFAFDALPIGEIALWIAMPTPSFAVGVAMVQGEPQTFAFAKVSIEADRETTAEFDLGASHPGFARVRIATNGREVAGIRVRALSPSGAVNAMARASGALDANGDVDLGPLSPGTYDLLVMHANVAWFTRLSAGLTIRAAETAHAEHRITLHRGTITLS
ncbi:MAG: carboxypeptidase regulatory-like domain-containing protein, partial [Planctomycetes bacterium]|nr:carboxypeptidase regulatory-like domain-containing protein [Planctomycetota bacterium]